MAPARGPDLVVSATEGRHHAQFWVYLVASAVLGGLTFWSMMWAVWGAPVGAAQVVALLGSVALLAAAFLSLGNAQRARRLGLAGLLSMGALWIPGVAALLPLHGVAASPWAGLPFVLYFAATGFALFHPRRWRWSLPAFVVLLGLAASVAGVTLAQRFRSGDLAAFTVATFRWEAGGERLVVDRDPEGRIDPAARRLLEAAGIRGRLDFAAASGEPRAARRVIVLAQRAPRSHIELHYPRDGLVIYAFDGERWRTLPPDAPTFPTSATLETEGSTTMLWQRVRGGRQGSPAFYW